MRSVPHIVLLHVVGITTVIRFVTWASSGIEDESYREHTARQIVQIQKGTIDSQEKVIHNLNERIKLLMEELLICEREEARLRSQVISWTKLPKCVSGQVLRCSREGPPEWVTASPAPIVRITVEAQAR